MVVADSSLDRQASPSCRIGHLGRHHHEPWQPSASRRADRTGEWLFCTSSPVLPLALVVTPTHPPMHILRERRPANPSLFTPIRSSNGNKTTRASGLSTAISPGMSRAVCTLTSWSGRPISKTWSFRRRRIRIVGIGPTTRAAICCRRSIRGCEVRAMDGGSTVGIVKMGEG